VLWTVLEKRGHANTAERIAPLLADREFVGRAGFDSRRGRDIGFRLRIEPDTRIANAQGRPVPA
jgi:hypothetical protein